MKSLKKVINTNNYSYNIILGSLFLYSIVSIAGIITYNINYDIFETTTIMIAVAFFTGIIMAAMFDPLFLFVGLTGVIVLGFLFIHLDYTYEVVEDTNLNLLLNNKNVDEQNPTNWRECVDMALENALDESLFNSAETNLKYQHELAICDRTFPNGS